MKPKIYAMIPARIGSQRLKYKNLAMINNKPMIYYTINAAKKSECFDKIFINSDHNIFSKISKKYKVNFYKRSKSLGGSNIKSDSIVYDFMKNNPEADILVWVNPIAPFQTAKEIKKIVNFFSKKKIDSLITVENKKIHCNYNNKPLNYIKNSKFSKTQNLKIIQTFVYSLMMWKKKSFIEKYKKDKNAILCGKTYFYPVKNLSTIIIKNFDDLKLANYVMKLKSKEFFLKYDKVLKKKLN
jgi:CMP-N-acetylneuraminic acid synthetase